MRFQLTLYEIEDAKAGHGMAYLEMRELLMNLWVINDGGINDAAVAISEKVRILIKL